MYRVGKAVCGLTAGSLYIPQLHMVSAKEYFIKSIHINDHALLVHAPGKWRIPVTLYQAGWQALKQQVTEYRSYSSWYTQQLTEGPFEDQFFAEGSAGDLLVSRWLRETNAYWRLE